MIGAGSPADQSLSTATDPCNYSSPVRRIQRLRHVTLNVVSGDTYGFTFSGTTSTYSPLSGSLRVGMETVQNGSFEEPITPTVAIPAIYCATGFDPLCEGSPGPSTAIPGWVVGPGSENESGDGSVDIARNGFLNCASATTWQTPDGAQMLDLNGVTPGNISQSIIDDPGQQYTLSFKWAVNDCTTRTSVRRSVKADVYFGGSGR